MNLTAIAVALVLLAQPAKKDAEPLSAPPAPALRPKATPKDVVALALADVATLPRDKFGQLARPFQFYVWNNLETREAAAAINFTVNSVVSANPRLVQPRIVGHLLVYDLAELLPKDADFDRVFGVLQEMAKVDPYFHQPGSASEVARTVRRKVRVWPYRASDGRVYDYRFETVTVTAKERAAEFAAHAGAVELFALSQIVGGNQLPIVRADWFLASAWTSIEIDGVVGRYYDLTGLNKLARRGETDFAAFVRFVGGDLAAAEDRGAAQRAALISDITGKWRRIDVVPANSTRVEFGPSILSVTRDIVDAESDAKRHSLLNLLNFQDQARELIASKSNGMRLYLLTNGAGAIVNEAPPDVAAWPASPHKGTTRLTVGIACVQCHGLDGGWKPAPNRVAEAASKGLLPLIDLGGGGADADAVFEQLKSLYLGDFSIALKASDIGYAAAVDRVTGGVFGERSVQGVSAATFKIYADYFALVTPAVLLAELGIKAADPTGAAAVLREVVPAVADDDGRIQFARLGFRLKRGDVHEVYFELALRKAFGPGSSLLNKAGRGMPKPYRGTRPAAGKDQPAKEEPPKENEPKGVFQRPTVGKADRAEPAGPFTLDVYTDRPLRVRSSVDGQKWSQWHHTGNPQHGGLQLTGHTSGHFLEISYGGRSRRVWVAAGRNRSIRLP